MTKDFESTIEQNKKGNFGMTSLHVILKDPITYSNVHPKERTTFFLPSFTDRFRHKYVYFIIEQMNEYQNA